MLFKSEKKEIKSIVIEAINESIGDFADKVEVLKKEYEGENLEAKIYFEKKTHLYNVLEKAIAEMEKMSPGCSDYIYDLMQDPEGCGYELDTENGMLGGGIYAVCYMAVVKKQAAKGDCAELNAKHAMLIRKVVEM